MNTRGFALRFQKMIRDKNDYPLEIVQVQPWVVHYKYLDTDYLVVALEGGRWVDVEVTDDLKWLLEHTHRRVIGTDTKKGNVIYDATLKIRKVELDGDDIKPSLQDMLVHLDHLT